MTTQQHIATNRKGCLIKMYNIKTTGIFVVLWLPSTILWAITPPSTSIWHQYSNQKSHSQLIDYSAVGVNYSNTKITVPDLPVFSVADFGAQPNDNIEDRDAIQKAIDAAESAGGGIVLFPAGKFLLNEQENRYSGIRISSSNIVLRGAGSGTSGTELFMKHALAAVDPSKKWSIKPMLEFNATDSTMPSSSSVGIFIAESKISKQAKRGDNHVSVAEPKGFKVGDLVTIDMQQLEANSEYLQGKKPRRIWKQILTKGVRVAETLIITAIKDDKLYFEQPLLTNVNMDYAWTIRSYPSISSVGIENLAFTGNFLEEFVHHINATHDSGFSAITFSRTSHSWVRDVRFKNVSTGATITGGVANSLLLNVIEGNRGHFSFTVTFGTRNLVGMNLDISNKGQWHGPGASHLSVGNVFWRFISPTSRGYDSHALYPRYTLHDNIQTFGMNGWGGSFLNRPHHLEGLVLWNYTQTGPEVYKLDYWDIDKPDHIISHSESFLTAVNPIIIGYQGPAKEYVKDSVGYMESFGKHVKQPASLYEAQLAMRLGKTPKWLEVYLGKWQKLQKTYLK